MISLRAPVQAGLNVADALEILVKLGGVGFAEAALQITGVLEHGVEDAALLGEHRFLLLDGRVVFGKKAVIGGEGTVLTGDGFATDVPGHRETGTVSGGFGTFFRPIELDGGEASLEPELRGGDLVGGDAVVEGLSGFGVAIGSGEPHRAARVAHVRVFVPKSLHDGKVRFVPFERFETGGEEVIGPRSFEIRVPALFSDAPTEAEEDESFGRSSGGGRRGKAAEAERFEDR